MLRSQERQLDRQAKVYMEERQRRREKIEQEASYVWRDIHRLDEELDRVREALELKRIKRRERAGSRRKRGG